jgi:hypothetical protein
MFMSHEHLASVAYESSIFFWRIACFLEFVFLAFGYCGGICEICVKPWFYASGTWLVVQESQGELNVGKYL